jgi:hypothetical protein
MRLELRGRFDTNASAPAGLMMLLLYDTADFSAKAALRITKEKAIFEPLIHGRAGARRTHKVPAC